MQPIYEGDFSPFGMGPVFQHHDKAVVFSYYQQTENLFGLMQVSEDFEVDTILQFQAQEVDYVSDDFRASEGYYGYTVGEGGQVTFCVGTGAEEGAVISLPTGRRIHGYAITQDTLVVSLAEESTDLTQSAGILLFDLKTGQPLPLEQMEVPVPLSSISVNESRQLCGFDNSTLKLYTLEGRVEKIEADTSMISGSFSKVLCNGSDFLVAVHDFTSAPAVWLIS